MARTSGSTAPRVKPSLRNELLFNLSVQAGGALLLALVSAALAPFIGRGLLGALLLTALVAADLVIFVAFGRYLVTRLVTGPMETLVLATQAVADGELSRRAPPGNTRELDRLAESVNRMTERLLDAQGALVSAEKLASVGRLAAGVAHEVGNPLAAIDNYVEVLRRRGADPEVVAAISREAARIDAIVRSLLDYARPRAVERRPLDLSAVAMDAVELLRTQGVLRGVTVDTACAPGLPPVLGDHAALEQVFVNLLLNAVDAAGEGGRLAVAADLAPFGEEGAGEDERRRTDPDGGAAAARPHPRPARFLDGEAAGGAAVQVVVADSGPGVPPALVGRIFDPFFTTKPPGRGTGLGLALVQRIVHDLGGRVDVARAREGGAAFTVTLPVTEP